jgi:hypothetical protein
MNNCLETKRPFLNMSRPTSPSTKATRSDAPLLPPPPAYEIEYIDEKVALLDKTESSYSWVDTIMMTLIGCISFIGFLAIPLSTVSTMSSSPQVTSVVYEDADTVIKVNISISESMSRRKQQYEDDIAWKVFGALWMGLLVIHFVGTGRNCLKGVWNQGAIGLVRFAGLWISSFLAVRL